MNAKILLVFGIIFCLFPAAYGENFSKIIIITPDELNSQAQELGKFYNQNIPTEIYKISDFENFLELDVGFMGYNDDSLCAWEQVKNYEHTGKFNYTLAKKIRKFLSQQNSSYVILFGNTTAIPPSYYYFDKYYYDPTDKYNLWVPTDLFYAVFDEENLTMKHAAGRILVSNEQDASAMVEKIKNYNKTISKIGLFGGKIFNGDDEYMDEISALHTLQNLNLNYTKFFETDGNFTSSKLADALKNYDLVFHFGHGSGVSACFSNKCVWGNLNTNSSAIFVSVACMNGAYDSATIPIWDYFSKSFAENLLKNDSITYVGGSRVNYGAARITLNNGSADNYDVGDMNEILEYFMTSKKNTTGEAYIDAFERMKNDGLDKYRLRTIMEFVLLGSPLLKFKKNNFHFTKENLTINISKNSRKTIGSNYYGIDGTLPVFYINDTVNISCLSSLNEDAFIKVIYTINSNTIIGGANLLNFSPDTKGLYLIKCTNRDEKRFYFKVENNVTYVSIIDAMAGYHTPDNNNNSLYDSFNVWVKVNVTESGTYTVSGKIDVAGAYIASASNTTYLTKGVNGVVLCFDGKNIRSSKKDGNFNINVEIYKDNDRQDKATKCCSPYYKYTDFESSASSFIKFSDIYEYGVNVTVDITKNGTYTINGDVYCNKSNVEDVYYEKNLTEGINEISIFFNKSAVAGKCAFGGTKFSFKNVTLRFNNSNHNDDFRCVALTTTYPELSYGNCCCDSCEKCAKKLVDANCNEINLTFDINFADGTCINLVNSANKSFDCNKHKIKGFFGYNYGINLKNSQNITIRNCAITNFFEGIKIDNANNIYLFNNSISSNRDNGINLKNSQNITIRNCAITNFFEGIKIDNANNIYLFNNSISSNRDNGIYIKNSACLFVANNSVFSNKWHGVSLDNLSNSTIAGNFINLNKNVGIYVYGSLLDITNNTILNNYMGIISYYSNLTINANTIRKNKNFDIYSVNWLLSYGDNNTCDKYDGWKDNSTDKGCVTKCRYPEDIFDVVEMLEYLSGEKGYGEIGVCVDANNDGFENLSDALEIITKIMREY